MYAVPTFVDLKQSYAMVNTLPTNVITCNGDLRHVLSVGELKCKRDSCEATVVQYVLCWAKRREVDR